MAQVTYTGEQPVWTPTLAQDGDTALGSWEPGESKEVPDELVEGLLGEGSPFSAGEGAQDTGPERRSGLFGRGGQSQKEE
jgi:hypothetical protein